MKLAEKYVQQLMEHCDAVQILLSKHNGTAGGTVNCFTGDGNWYARIGMAHEFLVVDKARTIAHETSTTTKNNDEDA